jgi:hypothetical protein
MVAHLNYLTIFFFFLFSTSASGKNDQMETAEAARPGMLAANGTVSNYKLIYFDARGICEPIRMLFHYAKVPFDDFRISRKQWLYRPLKSLGNHSTINNNYEIGEWEMWDGQKSGYNVL